MVIGSILLAPRADQLGRRTVIYLATGLIATAMLISTLAHNVETLTFLRFATGVGRSRSLRASAPCREGFPSGSARWP